MADLMGGFDGSLKPSLNYGPETNRNHAETSMKPSETKVDGHRRNRETAPLKGAVAGFAAHAARGSVAGRWAARTDSQPNIRRAITLDGDLPASSGEMPPGFPFITFTDRRE